MNKNDYKHDEDTMVAVLAATGRYKTLRKLQLDERPKAASDSQISEGSLGRIANDNGSSVIAAVVDVETTGLEPHHKIIELAIRRFFFDPDGKVSAIDRPYCWREDPGEPLDARITLLTGLTDADVAGQRIDEGIATTLLRTADVIIAHNAAFDRRFVECRLRGAVGGAWACTIRDVDWRRRGVSGYGLGWLLAQIGLFHEAHRAGSDVDAVIALLCHRDQDGQTALRELVDTASRPTWRLRAVGAAYEVKAALKARGYRWDSASTVWYHDVAVTEREAEVAWLADHVYAPNHRPRVDSLVIEPITWHTRYA